METVTLGAGLPAAPWPAAAPAAPTVTLGDLGQLLATAERAAFHGAPAAAVPTLEEAVGTAARAGQEAEAAAAGWLLGESLAAVGRYGSALDVFAPLLVSARYPGAGPERRLFGALAAAGIADVHRQLGRHEDAHNADAAGLVLADGGGEARFACQVGLAADAVGLGDGAQARVELDAAARLLPERGSEWWRHRVRLDWVRAEVSLLEEQPAQAAQAALAAVDRAEGVRAPRYVAKSLLFLGVARLQLGDPAAIGTLRRAATLAEGVGALPLVWPTRALLGALLGAGALDQPDRPDQTDQPTGADHGTDPGADAGESAACLAAARNAVLTIAGQLPAGLRAGWLDRPDLAALLSP